MLSSTLALQIKQPSKLVLSGGALSSAYPGDAQAPSAAGQRFGTLAEVFAGAQPTSTPARNLVGLTTETFLPA